MKITKIAIVMFALMGALASCKKDGNSPGDVAKAFMEAVDTKKWDEAKKLSTPESATMIDMLKSIYDMAPDSVKNKTTKFEITDEKIEGENATVTLSASDDESPKPKEEKIKLVKKEDKWLVNYSKESMMGGGMESEEGDMEMDPQDEMDSTVVPNDTTM